ncbi:unnamed protein product [Blepharisma stoltei]|uniref:Uncharacterized protein n=1 Tax=Blepharisma stoltei TaxID=1481888 RepID=A0AAU9JE71_9CILI|nr:unnamed protein product [Blepharisma stoltei]
MENKTCETSVDEKNSPDRELNSDENTRGNHELYASEIRKLEQTIKIKDAKIMELEDLLKFEKSNKKSTIDKFDLEISNLNNEISRLKSNQHSLRLESQTWQAKFSSLEQENLKIQDTLNIFLDKNKNLEEEVKAYQKSLIIKDKEIDRLYKEQEHIREESLHASAMEIKDLKNKNEHLSCKVTSLRNSIALLKGALSTAEENAKEKSKSLQKCIEKLESEKNQMAKEIVILSAELEEIQEQGNSMIRQASEEKLKLANEYSNRIMQLMSPREKSHSLSLEFDEERFSHLPCLEDELKELEENAPAQKTGFHFNSVDRDAETKKLMQEKIEMQAEINNLRRQLEGTGSVGSATPILYQKELENIQAYVESAKMRCRNAEIKRENLRKQIMHIRSQSNLLK